MRKRKHSFVLRLDEKEYRYLCSQLERTGLKREQYIRSLILGHEVRSRPPVEYANLLRELSAIGNNINQLARIANTGKTVSEQTLAEIKSMQSSIWKKVKNM